MVTGPSAWATSAAISGCAAIRSLATAASVGVSPATLVARTVWDRTWPSPSRVS